MTDAKYFLPLAGPMPPNTTLPRSVAFPSSHGAAYPSEFIPVLGPPIHRDTIAAPLSAEARAVLEAAVRWVNEPEVHSGLGDAARDYARSIAPPDPLAEAREALNAARCHTVDDAAIRALDRIEAALAKLGDRT